MEIVFQKRKDIYVNKRIFILQTINDYNSNILVGRLFIYLFIFIKLLKSITIYLDDYVKTPKSVIIIIYEFNINNDMNNIILQFSSTTMQNFIFIIHLMGMRQHLIFSQDFVLITGTNYINIYQFNKYTLYAYYPIIKFTLSFNWPEFAVSWISRIISFSGTIFEDLPLFL